MCLTKLGKFKVKLDENGVGTGWKVFAKMKNKLYLDFRGTQHPRPKNQWLNEKDYRWKEDKVRGRIYYDNFKYKFGWHIMKTKRSAEKWMEGAFFGNGDVVMKVKFRKVVATGIQMKKQVIVAKEIFIPDDNK